MSIADLIMIADENEAEKQMSLDQYDCFIELILDGTIDTKEELEKYIIVED